MTARAPEELPLPSSEWSWESNWRITKKPGATDKDGWEYASRMERFTVKDRTPKPEKAWNDKARRRKWSRVMRRDSRVGKTAQFMEATPKIQKGLRSIHTVRIRIEEVVKKAPDAMQEPQMIRLVDTVRSNMLETLNTLNKLDASGLNASQVAVIKKLRNDLQKEQAAIENAVSACEVKQPSPPGSLKASSLGNRSHLTCPSPTFNRPITPSPSPVTGRHPAHSSSRNVSGTTSLGNSPMRGGRQAATSGSNGSMHVDGPKLTRGLPVLSETMSSSRSESRLVTASTYSSPGVTSGGRNVPLSLSVSNLNSDSAVDGVFMKRTEQEKIILQKLKPVDQATVQGHIIEERAVAIEEIHKGLVEVNEMFNDLSKIIKDQQVDVDTIFANCDESHAKTAEAFSQIVEADRLQQESACIIS
eukprot:CAMPEP_0185029148 /NCGR_PEP_ID=MMETSP1103-20130426/15277_1 /TAXON_ID=36769 /ORGANISM="Paraphysomonas bandaiensis, Strain Caron Lab Isolate" /LENGTH=416 /DNA_ID=CAMNT_0027563787 /DNA_START=185 /DNA_END=1435 /DNA_ORIENTATION=-